MTYFSLSPWVEAVGVAVLVGWTWGYWWDWSGLIHYEDAPYMTEGSGQWGETQIKGGIRWWMQGLAMSHPHHIVRKVKKKL